MEIRKLRRRWIVAGVAVVLLVATIRNLDSAQMIYYYRVVDDRTVVVGTVTGHGAWTRVTGVSETPSTVTITVSSLLVQLGAGTAEGVRVESVATLRAPIGSRTVVDGSNGLTVQRCLLPSPAVPTACL